MKSTCEKNRRPDQGRRGMGRRCGRARRVAVRLVLLLTFALLLSGTSGCTRAREGKITIGRQFGVAYAPLEIMRLHGLLEERLPGIEIAWEQYGGPTPIREGMLNGDVTFGFMGVSPALIGAGGGMPWQILCGLSANQVAVVVSQPEASSLADLEATDRIAVLSPGCTQHVLLSKLARDQLGDAQALDAQLVYMSHPDATAALLSGTEVSAHVATPPYIQEEVAGGMTVLADGEEILGEPFTFICGVAMTETIENRRSETDAFLAALAEAMDYINNHTEEACEELTDFYGIPAESLAEQMRFHGTIFSTEVTGLTRMAEVMVETGFLESEPDMEELLFDGATNG